MIEHLTQKEAAKRLEITPRRLRDLSNGGDISRFSDGSYPWPLADAEYRFFRTKTEEDRKSGFGDSSYEEARTRKLVAQAREVELRVAESVGSLIALEDVVDMLTEPLEMVAAALKAAPGRHAHELAQAAKIPVVQAQEIIHDIADEMRKDLMRIGDELEASVGAGRSAAARREARRAEA